MQIIRTPQELQEICLPWRFSGLSTALVPTMGFFHAGHESLMRHARAHAEKCVVSLFVNPSQFGPGEDLASYPRDFERDARIAESLGMDILFAPEPGAMYAEDHAAWIEVPALAGTLCGLSRPTHFRGVCTVVAKLFMLVLPQIAYFGEKDWQQLAILKRMVRDLNMPVRVEGRPIVREADGLAMSSRNAYLTAEERAMAPALFAGLRRAAEALAGGEKDSAKLMDVVRAYWAEHLPAGREEYLMVTDPENLNDKDRVDEPALMAAAVRLGNARLIDNIVLRP